MPLRPSSSSPSASSPSRGSTTSPAKPATPSGPAAGPTLIPQGGHAGKPGMPLTRPFILIGSRNRAHVHLVSHTVSRTHAAIINTDHGSYVRDLASRTHTFVNGSPVQEAALKHSDAIQFGSFQFRFSDKSGRGAVEEGPRAPRAVLHPGGGNAPVPIEGRTLLIGQRPVCDLYLPDASVSTAHAIVFELNGRHYVRDLGSRTGTLVNGRPAHQEVLEFGDEVRIGPATLRYASATEDHASLADDAGEEDPLAGTGAGVAAVAAIGTAAAMDDAAELDFTTAEAEPDLVVTSPESVGLDPLPVDPDPFPIDIELDPASTATPADLVADEAATPMASHDAVAAPAGPGEGDAPYWPAAPASGTESPDDVATEAEIFEPIHVEASPSDAGAPADGTRPSAVNATSHAGVADPFAVDLDSPELEPLDIGGTSDALPALAVPAAGEDIPLDLDLDFSPEADAAGLTGEPFGPLTDLNLMSHLEPAPADLAAAARAPVLDPAPEPEPLETPGSVIAYEHSVSPQENVAIHTATTAPVEELAVEDSVAEEPVAEVPPVEAPDAAADVPSVIQTEAGPADAPRWTEPTAGEPAIEFAISVPQADEAMTAAAAPPLEVPEAPAESIGTYDELVAIEEVAPAPTETPAADDVSVTISPGVEPDAFDDAEITLAQAPPVDELVDVALSEELVVEPPAADAPGLAEISDAVAAGEVAAEAPAPPGKPAKETKRRRKPAAIKPAAKPPAATKKKRWWGKKAAEAAAAAAQPMNEATAEAPDEAPAMPFVETEVAEAGAADGEPAVPAAEVVAVDKFIEPTSDPVSPPDEVGAASVVETVDLTEPTPESAFDLDLGTQAPAAAAEPSESGFEVSATTDAATDGLVNADLSTTEDAAFDEILNEFAGSSTGPIVEDPAGLSPIEAPVEAAVDTPFEAHVESGLETGAAAVVQPEPAGGEPAAEADATDVVAPAEPLQWSLANEAAPPAWDVAATTSESPAESPAFIDDTAAPEHDASALAPEAVQLAPAPVELDLIPPAPPAEDAAPTEDDIERVRNDINVGDVPRLDDLEELAPAPPVASPNFDPFRGMGRDEGSFIGGMPFDFGMAAPVVAPLAPLAPLAAPPAPDLPPLAASDATPDTTAPSDLEDWGTGEDVSATTSDTLEPADGLSLAGGAEPELDLSLPDLDDLGELEPAAPQARAEEDPFADAGLDLPDLPPLDAPETPIAAADFPPLDGPHAPPAAPVESDVEPLSFTEAEAETLQLLPKPQPPQPPRAEAPPTGRARADRQAPSQPAPSRGGRTQQYPATTPPPARGHTPRRQARAGFDLDADLGAGFDIPPAAPPRAAKPAPKPGAGGATPGGFNGLAMPPVREADVFSPMAFGGEATLPPDTAGLGDPLNEESSDVSDDDLSAALDVPPAGLASDLGLGSGLTPPRAGEASAPILGLTGLASAPAARRGGVRPPAGGPREPGRPGQRGPAPDPGVDRWEGDAGPPEALFDPTAAPPPARARGRRVGLGVLLLLMALSLAGAGAAVWKFGPRPEVEVVGTLQFDRLRDLGELDRRRVEQAQREILLQRDFRMQAREILKVADEQMAYGFLGESDEEIKAYDKAVQNAQVKDRSNNFVVYYRGHDRFSDKARMQALLKALYARNGVTKDQTETLRGNSEAAQRELKRLTDEIEQKKKEIAAMREQGERMPELQEQLKRLQADDERLRAAARDAQREVDRLQAELEQADAPAARPPQPGAEDAAPAGNDGGETAGAGPQLVAISSAAAPVPPGDNDAARAASAQDPSAQDPQVRQWRIQLDQLRGAGAAARSERSRRLERASKSLDEALQRFDAEVADAGRQLQGGSQLGPYVAAGQKMQDALREANADLARQQKGDRDFLNDMKRRLAEKSENHLKEAWANDPELRQLEEELAIRERHRNAALGGSLRKEAAGLDAEIAAMGRQIETRRDLIGTGRAYAVEVQELHQFIDRTLKRMEEERVRNDRRVEGLLAGFAAEAPSIEKLPDGQKQLAAALEKRSHELADARRQYGEAAAASDAASDDTARQQEQQAAALQAKITARRRQIAFAAVEQLTAQQQQDRDAKTQKLRADLAAARKKSDQAISAAEQNLQKIIEAKAALATARESADRIAAAQRDQAAAEQALAQARTSAAKLQGDLAKAVRPVEPGDDAVSVNPAGEDPRPMYMLYAGAAIVAAFSALMWLTAHGGEGPPLADRATYDVLSRRPEPGAVRRDAHARSAAGEPAGDDEEPLTV